MNYIEDTIEKTRENKEGKVENVNGIFQQLLKIDKRVAIIMAVDSMTAGIDTVTKNLFKIINIKNNKHFKLTDCICDHRHPLLSCEESRQASKTTRGNFKSIFNFGIKCQITFESSLFKSMH